MSEKVFGGDGPQPSHSRAVSLGKLTSGAPCLPQSEFSLCWVVSRCKNGYQPFLLARRLEPPRRFGAAVQILGCHIQRKEKTASRMGYRFSLEVTAGFEPADNGVADRGLTTWLRHHASCCLNIITELSGFVNRLSQPFEKS